MHVWIVTAPAFVAAAIGGAPGDVWVAPTTSSSSLTSSSAAIVVQQAIRHVVHVVIVTAPTSDGCSSRASHWTSKAQFMSSTTAALVVALRGNMKHCQQ